MTRGKQLGALGAALLLTLSLITPLCSAEETPIRVGYIDYVSFLEPQPDGTATGYMGDYLWEIARYTDLRYHYVSASWADCLNLLDQHKLDLVCMAKRTPEREARYDFSDQPVGLSQQVLYTRPDNDALYYEDFAALEGASVGFLQGSVNLRLFADYARRNHFSYQTREYPREADLETALHTGEVDAIAIEHLAYHDDLKLIGRYGSEPFYFITWKGNPLMEELNYALSEIGARDPSLAARLFETYYGDSGAETQPLYTREEAAYIRTAPVLTVGN
ncbi:MAG: transporter substrate-binding domain-containing protein, partial [Oscillospiraceae bacterium]